MFKQFASSLVLMTAATATYTASADPVLSILAAQPVVQHQIRVQSNQLPCDLSEVPGAAIATVSCSMSYLQLKQALRMVQGGMIEGSDNGSGVSTSIVDDSVVFQITSSTETASNLLEKAKTGSLTFNLVYQGPSLIKERRGRIR